MIVNTTKEKQMDSKNCFHSSSPSPEEPVSEGLEEAAKNHAVERYRATRDIVLAEKCKWSFKVGAEWQKQKIKRIVDRINVDNHNYEDLEDLYDALCEMVKTNEV